MEAYPAAAAAGAAPMSESAAHSVPAAESVTGEWILSEVIYDTLGRVQKTSRPYFTSGVHYPDWTIFGPAVYEQGYEAESPEDLETARAYEELRDSLGLDPALERLLSAA